MVGIEAGGRAMNSANTPRASPPRKVTLARVPACCKALHVRPAK